MVGCSIDSVYFHKVNYIHIPIILYGGIGIWWLGGLFKDKRAFFLTAMTCAYTACFGYYIYYQATYPIDYDAYGYPWVSHMNLYRYEDALAYAEKLTSEDISVIALNYANVMLHAQIPPDEFWGQWYILGIPGSWRLRASADIKWGHYLPRTQGRWRKTLSYMYIPI